MRCWPAETLGKDSLFTLRGFTLIAVMTSVRQVFVLSCHGFQHQTCTCAVRDCRRYGESLISCNKSPQALSLLQKTLQLRKETLGPRHYQTLKNMVSGSAPRRGCMHMCRGVGMAQVCVCMQRTSVLTPRVWPVQGCSWWAVHVPAHCLTHIA